MIFDSASNAGIKTDVSVAFPADVGWVLSWGWCPSVLSLLAIRHRSVVPAELGMGLEKSLHSHPWGCAGS